MDPKGAESAQASLFEPMCWSLRSALTARERGGLARASTGTRAHPDAGVRGPQPSLGISR
eukprot:14786447-Alexandrium_andersonii.AAC.1